MKKILIFILFLLLTGCHQFTYQLKSEINPDYYFDYLETLGYNNIELMEGNINAYDLDMLYQSLGISVNTKSDFIYYYICYDSFGTKYNALMPDRVGEQDIVFQDLISYLGVVVSQADYYNHTTAGVPFQTPDGSVETMDIIIRMDEIEFSFVSELFTSRKVNGVKIEVDEDNIKTLIEENLSLPLIYHIGRYYDGGNTVKQVYLGKGPDNQYVFILEDYQTATVQILYQFSMDPYFE